MMWVERCDSWGPANTVCPGFLLNVLKMDSGLSKKKKKKKKPRTLSCILALRKIWASLPKTPKTKRCVRTVAPHGSSCKGHTFCCMEGPDEHPKRGAMLQFNTKTQFGVDYFKTALGLRAPVNRISQCDVLSCPTFFNFFFYKGWVCSFPVWWPWAGLPAPSQITHQVWTQYNKMLQTEALTSSFFSPQPHKLWETGHQ